MWNRMIARVGKFRQGEMSLARLVDDLRGLYVERILMIRLSATPFEQHWSIIDSELEIRTEPWASPGAASEQRLTEALVDFESWVQGLLVTSGSEHG